MNIKKNSYNKNHQLIPDAVGLWECILFERLLVGELSSVGDRPDEVVTVHDTHALSEHGGLWCFIGFHICKVLGEMIPLTAYWCERNAHAWLLCDIIGHKYNKYFSHYIFLGKKRAKKA